MSILFQVKDLTIEHSPQSQLRTKPDWNNLRFGHHFSDHMLEIQWTAQTGWQKPKISPFHNLNLHPAAKCLHYATEVSKIFADYTSLVYSQWYQRQNPVVYSVAN